MDQLAKMIKGYEEKNNTTTEMMKDTRKVFKEKLQALEKENKVLKEKANKTEYSNSEKSLTNQSGKTEKEKEVKVAERNTKSLKSSTTSSS